MVASSFFAWRLIYENRPFIKGLTRDFRHIPLTRCDKIKAETYLFACAFRQGMLQTGPCCRITDDIHKCPSNGLQNAIFQC